MLLDCMRFWGLPHCLGFNGHPPLGVNATSRSMTGALYAFAESRFNEHPPLGVNATTRRDCNTQRKQSTFQRAPTLGGECYTAEFIWHMLERSFSMFQRAPTLGGECYSIAQYATWGTYTPTSFNGHPPLGVNATWRFGLLSLCICLVCFNGHPPLGVNATRGLFQCRTKIPVGRCFNGHPPLGVNATNTEYPGLSDTEQELVSMGTHPWG